MRARSIAFLLIVLPAALHAEEPKKLSVPDANVTKGQKAIQEVFGPEIEKAKTPAARKALATRLLGIGNDVKESAENRWVAYRKACEIAAAVGDIGLTTKIVDDTLRAFDVSRGEMVVEAAEKLSKKLTATEVKQLVDWLGRVADEAVQADDYKTAERLLAAGSRVAPVAKDAAISKHLELRRLRVKELAKEFDDVVGIDEHMGKFQCFRKGDWKKGLPLLVNAQDDALKAIVARDLMNPGESKDRIALGDSWFDIAEAKKDIERYGMMRRAFFWYRGGFGGTAGLAKAKVEARLSKILDQLDKEAGVKRHRWVDGNFELKMVSPGEWVQKINDGTSWPYHEVERTKDYVEMEVVYPRGDKHAMRVYSTNTEFRLDQGPWAFSTKGKWAE